MIATVHDAKSRGQFAEYLLAFPDGVAVTVNGRAERLRSRPDARLIDALRSELGLLSVREACGIGMCGSCTVAVDGRITSACLTLVGQIAESRIETVEALEHDGRLDDLQEGFVTHNAFQCSYCTPGFLLAARELLAANSQPSRDEIRHALAGNLCRCGSYLKIEAAVQEVARTRREARADEAPAEIG